MQLFLGYIDPGSGSIVVQLVVGAVLGTGYAARQHIARLVNRIRPGKRQVDGNAKDSTDQ